MLKGGCLDFTIITTFHHLHHHHHHHLHEKEDDEEGSPLQREHFGRLLAQEPRPSLQGWKPAREHLPAPDGGDNEDVHGDDNEDDLDGDNENESDNDDHGDEN